MHIEKEHLEFICIVFGYAHNEFQATEMLNTSSEILLRSGAKLISHRNNWYLQGEDTVLVAWIQMENYR